jgi:hypothetical protein
MAVVQSTPKEEEVDQAQFRLKAAELLHQATMQSLAKDRPGAIARFTEGIELTEGYMRERPEMAATLGPMLPEAYFLRALEWHTLSRESGKPEKKSQLASALQDIDKALSFPDAYYTRGKDHLRNLQEMIKKDQSSCFIATAAYGSPVAPEVSLLRRFRDVRLRRSQPGRLIIRLYEWSSPPLAAWIAERPVARRWVRRLVLAPMVKLARRWTSS